MPLKGIIIDEPWISEILSGRKTWEMRGKTWKHRGEVALIRKGSGKIVGMARMTDCLDRLDEAELRRTENLHRIPPAKIAMAIDKRWTIPWVLEDVQPLSEPVAYVHKSGAQTPVNIDEAAEHAVQQQLHEGAFEVDRTAESEFAVQPVATSHYMAGAVEARTSVQRVATPPGVARAERQMLAHQSQQRTSENCLGVVAIPFATLGFVGWLVHLFAYGFLDAFFGAGFKWLAVGGIGALLLGFSGGSEND